MNKWINLSHKEKEKERKKMREFLKLETIKGIIFTAHHSAENANIMALTTQKPLKVFKIHEETPCIVGNKHEGYLTVTLFLMEDNEFYELVSFDGNGSQLIGYTSLKKLKLF